MKIHEFQAKDIFRRYQVPVPRGRVVEGVDGALAAARELGVWPVVLKAQIHAGGRGKGGGIKLARSEGEVKELARKMIGMNLVTPQTGPKGREVRWLLVEEGMSIDREIYLAILLDRAQEKLIVMASAAGGMDIEAVAHDTPDKILISPVDPLLGLTDHQVRELGFNLGLPGTLVPQFARLVRSLYNVYIGEDASLAEINPLIVTKEETPRVLALDAKLLLDDNALVRHKANLELRDESEEEPLEVEASRANLNYIKLDGNVGCMVNGAGLAMATMDLIKLAGGEPANFLDVGGGASPESVSKAFEIILKDPNVKAVLINIFGGIVRCDRVARGVIDAAHRLEVKVPVLIRLDGTNMEEAFTLLRESGLDFRIVNGLEQAAEEVVKALQAR